VIIVFSDKDVAWTLRLTHRMKAKLRITNYELRGMKAKLRIAYYELRLLKQ